MRRYFLLISFVICAVLLKSCVTFPSESREQIDRHYVWENERIRPIKHQFRLEIEINNKTVSGILITKYVNDEILGSFVNEFGVKYFDFKMNNKKCKLENVVEFIDKWYIKKVIASDLLFLFKVDTLDDRIRDKYVYSTIDGKLTVENNDSRKLIKVSEEELLLQNKTRGIQYFLSVIK